MLLLALAEPFIFVRMNEWVSLNFDESLDTLVDVILYCSALIRDLDIFMHIITWTCQKQNFPVDSQFYNSFSSILMYFFSLFLTKLNDCRVYFSI